jgi:hypothetical protein
MIRMNARDGSLANFFKSDWVALLLCEISSRTSNKPTAICLEVGRLAAARKHSRMALAIATIAGC